MNFMFDALPTPLNSVVPFLIVLGVLVFIHELGHYLAARWRGVHVEAFSIGFGRAIFSWTDRRGTVWKLSWLPLGGYVKLHGQEQPEDADEATKAAWQAGKTFHEKSVLSRAIVIAAGPLANFVLAAVLFAGLFLVMGRPVATSQIGEVVATSAAARGGLQVGDVVTAIDGQVISRFDQLRQIVGTHPGQALKLHVVRGDQALDLTVTPDTREIGGVATGLLGVRGGATVFEPISTAAALGAGVTQTWDVTVQTFDGVIGMITRRTSADDMGGPLRIAQMSGQVASLGLASLVSFIAILSVNLGLLNLFPIPVLDGGHLVFYAFEALRGRPLPVRAQEYGYRAGFAVLIGLFVFATWNDLGHLGLFRWVAGLIG
jgi:regulator of sigma E protease